MDRQIQLTIYRAMFTARQIDHAEQELTHRGEAFFQISAGGHEATAALAAHLTPHDWLHCHYRDKALLIARGLPLDAFFDNLLCKDRGASRGRQMSAFFSEPRLHILSMVTPTGNNALQAVGVAAAVRDQEHAPIVYCGVGDGTTQQGEFLEAVGEAVRRRFPVLFVIQNNRYAISTPTDGTTFFSLPQGRARDLFGVAIESVDGRDAVAAGECFQNVVNGLRADRLPRIVVMDVDRLSSHTNADDHRIYRGSEDLARESETGDSVRNLKARLLAGGFSAAELSDLEAEVTAEVAAAEARSLAGPDPVATAVAKRALPASLSHPAHETEPSGAGSDFHA